MSSGNARAFDRVARFAKGAQALKKQKAIRIVVDNLNDHLSKSEFKAELRVLGALMDKESVREQVDKLVNLTKGKITSKKLKTATNSLNTVALISQLGNYTCVIEAGGPQHCKSFESFGVDGTVEKSRKPCNAAILS